MDTKELLMDFCAKSGISGIDDATRYARQALQNYGIVAQSPLDSVVCTVKQPKENGIHLLLDAHIDEIGLIVTCITKDGFLRVQQIGGVDPRLLSASLVTIHTQTKPITGIVCSTPPHLSGSQQQENPTVEDIYIDIGYPYEKASTLVAPGDRVTFPPISLELHNNRVATKAIDDRSGCIALLKALEYLKNDIPCGLTVQFSNMEEFGGQGAKTSAYSISPTHALAVDVSFALSPGVPTEKAGIMSHGPMVGISPMLDHQISAQLITLAKQNDIPYQTEVMGGRTGTNADSIVTTRNGVKTGLLSIPIRYMHMPIETVAISDIEYTAKLIMHWVQSFGTGGL